jgi:hypothetical protein
MQMDTDGVVGDKFYKRGEGLRGVPKGNYSCVLFPTHLSEFYYCV